MPMYEYACPNGHRFEEIRSIDDRKTCPCPSCGQSADQRITPVRLDSRMNTPSAALNFRKQAIRRALGLDMTSANRTVRDESIDRNAFERRKASGQGKITTN